MLHRTIWAYGSCWHRTTHEGEHAKTHVTAGGDLSGIDFTATTIASTTAFCSSPFAFVRRDTLPATR